MSGEVSYRGLCASCENAPSCTFTRDPGRPVLQCEEFDGGVSSPPKTAGRDVASVPRPHATEDKDSAELRGLCVDCEERQTCTYPKPEGGVWHCEEYR